ncbi:sugar transferase [Actinotalea sp. JY-7885]|uniref:sugar transferase n=1 Tax=Actinotalea sp. JY-7885 TaxID=2758576 RepID=UPI0035C9935C
MLRRDETAQADPASVTAANTNLAPVQRPWWAAYASRILLTDAIAVYIAILVAYLVRINSQGVTQVSGDFSPSYLAVSVVLMWAWIFALVVGRAQDRRLLGVGAAEYQRVIAVSWRLFAGVAVIAYMLRMDIGRSFLGVAFPLGVVLLLLGRFACRQWLRRQRRKGEARSRLLLVGHARRVEEMLDRLRADSPAGFAVVGVAVPEGEHVTGWDGVHSMDGAGDAAKRLGVDMVAVVGADTMTADAVRRLGWDLEGTGVDLALTVALTDIAGPRIVLQPVSGLPLVYVDEPRFTGPKYAMKSLFDWLTALVLLVALSPLLIVIAVLVKATSAGPVLYRQERVGINGRRFQMLKFRSMEVNAHERLGEVLAAEGHGGVGLFYKPKNDPRVTTVGRVLRKYSLDELPQLLNVLRGEMSLVGPRPQVEEEVAQYDRRAQRRLLVKPGLTGLWQISGRSDLEPEEAIRMDVFYVENWTLIGDLILMAKTVRVVAGGSGAY